MTPDEFDDDPIAQLVRAARPSAPVGLADRVLAASVAAPHGSLRASLRRRRAVAAAAGAAVAIAAVVAVLVVRRAEPRMGAEPAGPTPEPSRSSESELPATRPVPVEPITGWGDAAMLVAQRLLPVSHAIVACSAGRAPYVLRLEIRVNARLVGDVGVAGAARASVIGSPALTATESCVDRAVAGVVLPALPAQLSAAWISLVISPAASPAITVPIVPPQRHQVGVDRPWPDPVAYVLSLLAAEFTNKPSGGDTALSCISKGRRNLEPPRGIGDLVFVVEQRLRYVMPDNPTKLDRCLESHMFRIPFIELASGVDRLELAFARPKSAR